MGGLADQPGWRAGVQVHLLACHLWCEPGLNLNSQAWVNSNRDEWVREFFLGWGPVGSTCTISKAQRAEQ